jgi:uncharacterized protein YjiS (DUF1127 family)
MRIIQTRLPETMMAAPVLPRALAGPAPAVGLSGLGRLLAGGIDRLLTWQQRRVGRRALQSMSDRTLHDIGLTRADVLRESRKAFWVP